MKKVVSMLLVTILLFSVFSCISFSALSSFSMISQIGNIEMEKSNVTRISYNVCGEKVSDNGETLTNENIALLVELFSDQNLRAADVEITQPIVGGNENYPRKGEFAFSGNDGYSWQILFDENKVLVVKIIALDGIMMQGLFLYKNDECRERLFDFYDSYFSVEDDENDEQEEVIDVVEKNQISISNFEIDYIAKFPSKHFTAGYEWGVCSYVRENETKPVSAIFVSFMNEPECKLFCISENVGENNTVFFPCDKTVKILDDNTDGIEYDSDDWLYTIEIQVNVGKDGEVTDVTVQYDHKNAAVQGTECADMEKYIESGSIPSGLFEITEVVEEEKPQEVQKENQEVKEIEKQPVETEEKEETEISDNKEETELEKDIADEKIQTLTHQQKAEVLQYMNLFHGTDKGFELEKTLTRAEAATMIVRITENENDAETGMYNTVFMDVAQTHWAFKNVMFAYNNGFIKGTSKDTYEPERDVTAEEFLTLVLRTMEEKGAEPENAVKKALERKLITETEKEEIESSDVFSRGQMVSIVYAAVNMNK